MRTEEIARFDRRAGAFSSSPRSSHHCGHALMESIPAPVRFDSFPNKTLNRRDERHPRGIAVRPDRLSCFELQEKSGFQTPKNKTGRTGV